MRLSPSLDKVGCWSSHFELTVGPRFTGADHGPNCWATAAEQNTAKSVVGTKTADKKRPFQILNLLVMCSSLFSEPARQLSGKAKKEAIPQESPNSLLNLPSYFSEK
jgi:hypothetical protein